MRQTTDPPDGALSEGLFDKPPVFYRPPSSGEDGPTRRPGLHESGGSGNSGDSGLLTGGPVEKWGGRDLIGAIGISIAAIAFVLFAGVSADLLAENADAGTLFRSVAIAAVSLALVVTTAVVTRLPKASTLNLLGLAAIANVLVHVLSEAGESNLLGLPPDFIESAILSGIPFGAAWLYVSRKRGRSLRDLGLVRPASPTAYLTALGAWLAAYVAVVVWSLLVAEIETLAPPDNATSALEIAGGSVAVAWLLVGLWGPAVEEIFFRGFLLGGLRSRFGPWPAIVISSGVFAVFHILPGLYVPTFLLGVAFGWVYLKTRSIWPAIFAHTLHNTLVLVIVWQDIG